MRASYQRGGLTIAERAMFRIEFQKLTLASTPTRTIFGGKFEDFAELPVPANKMLLAVEHGDALADVIERGLQEFPVIVDRCVGVVEQLECGLGRSPCACAAATTAPAVHEAAPIA